jgi:hypothetical protein
MLRRVIGYTYTVVADNQGVTGFDIACRGRGSEPRKPTSSRESFVGKQ